jgi:hypothetical protein
VENFLQLLTGPDIQEFGKSQQPQSFRLGWFQSPVNAARQALGKGTADPDQIIVSNGCLDRSEPFLFPKKMPHKLKAFRVEYHVTFLEGRISGDDIVYVLCKR